MSVARIGCGAAWIDELLYVVGGDDADDSAVASSECYDPATKQRQGLPDMSIARANVVAVALP